MAGQRHQRHDAAFAAVVGAQHESHVFDGNHENQRPEDQRQNAEDVFRRGGDALAGEAFAQGIQRAGADIAVYHAQGGQGQACHGLFVVILHMHPMELFVTVYCCTAISMVLERADYSRGQGKPSKGRARAEMCSRKTTESGLSACAAGASGVAGGRRDTHLYSAKRRCRRKAWPRGAANATIKPSLHRITKDASCAHRSFSFPP